MTDRTATGTVGTSPLVYARVAGFTYLFITVVSLLAWILIESNLIVPGDAVATADSIMASESLFRLSIVSDLAVQIAHILLVLVLYKLLKPVSRN